MSADASLASGIEQARRWLTEADRVVVLTGAGISTDSGIPDFRGPKGLWTRNPEAEKMATLQVYVADPEVRRRAWRWRLETRAAQPAPNAGHAALVDLERLGRLDTLVTQNVDGLHQSAGSDPDRVVEIHGTLREVECLGSTLAVYPVAAMVPIAKEQGARIVILNGEPTEMDPIADLVLHGSIGEMLPKLVPDR